jgi:ABC-type amino acid transport substrate-binding protein
MKFIKNLLILSIIFFSNTSIATSIKVSVGGYIFPPFIYQDKNEIKGITIDLLKLLNENQSKYIFEFHLTSSKRRYRDFKNGLYDLIFFENKKWGWNNIDISNSSIILKGGEVFIAHNVKGRNQKYFHDLKNKKVLGILGYHYEFANFKTDRKYLKEKFNVEVRTNHESNIHTIAKRNLDQVAIVTKSLLNLYLKKNPRYKNSLIVSNKMDQVYEHQILFRENSPLSYQEISSLLKDLDSKGLLSKLWDKYAIDKKDQISLK